MEVIFPKLEKRILKVWRKNKIFEKSIQRRAKTRDFVFYEGPPYANGRPGIHHFLARAFKDLICRYKTMQGFKVLRKSGWDTHGLPTEMEVEKKLGISSKKEIEKLGIEKFIKECKKNVFIYKKEWEKFTERMGYWLDLKNPYITCDNDYIETVWWILKEIWKKGLLYQDFKVVPYCPRCQTSLSSHEVALGYEKIKEPAIYIKVKILNPEFKSTSLLVWTTTPWTLPGNVAIAVNPNFKYVKLRVGEEYLILAKERVKPCDIEGEILQELNGKDLLNLYYQALYPVESQKGITIYKTLPANFVSLEEGTGLVHIAPAFGEEDMETIKIANCKLQIANLPEIPILLTVNEEGKFTLDVKKWAGIFVKDADPLIIEDLKERNLLFKEELYEHDYPFCWRCHTPLLYYAKKSWFIKMTKVKKDLIKNNKKINWIPAHLKEGRFGEWLKEIKDWALSRERYWGTPLPIWQCKNCGNLEVIGSKADLLSQKFSKNNYFLLRHGDALTNKKGINCCWPEKVYCSLTRKGQKQTEKAVKELKNKKIDIIFSSDLLRTRQTAEIIARECGSKIEFDKRIREVNVGIYNGRPIELARQAWGEPLERFEKKLPKGESYNDVKKRMYKFLKDINEQYQGKNILIISHECPISLLECALKGFSNGEIVKYRGGAKRIKTGEWRKLEFKMLPYNEKMQLDFHRPHIDEVKFLCSKCEGLMEKVPEVIDCWFDSGAMPFAQYHYPFENKKLIDEKKQFPADYISEAVDQTRGWFYTLHAISTLLKNSPAYRNVISLSHVLDEKGEKMSKSKGNVVAPWYIVEKYGTDATRWYFYTVNQPGDSKLFSEKNIAEALRKFIMTFWNCFSFFQTYSSIVHFSRSLKLHYRNFSCLDRWVISKLNGLIGGVTNSLDKYDVTGAARSIENFVINDLSLWYIRRSRPRFQKPKTKDEASIASSTLNFILLTLSKLTAPFIPFLSEEIYRGVTPVIYTGPTRAALSVHLEDWPEGNKKLINKKLEREMELVREIVGLALAERAKAKIKIRQPLSELQITNYELKNKPELLELLKEEVNVKKIAFGKTLQLDTKITPELKEEGQIREIIRHIQEMRKEAKLKPKDRILVRYFTSPDLKKILVKNENAILQEGRITDFRFKEKEKERFDIEKDLKVEQKNLWLGIKKI